jgi:hypothetical protein
MDYDSWHHLWNDQNLGAIKKLVPVHLNVDRKSISYWKSQEQKFDKLIFQIAGQRLNVLAWTSKNENDVAQQGIFTYVQWVVDNVNEVVLQ